MGVGPVDPRLPEDEQIVGNWELSEDWGDGGLAQDKVAGKSLERMGYRLAALLLLQPTVKTAVPADRAEDVEALVERIREEVGLPGDGDDDEDAYQETPAEDAVEPVDDAESGK